MNTITVTLELTEENLMKLRTLISSKVAVVASGETVSAADPMPAEDIVITDPPKEETKEISFTKSDLRAVALKLSKADKKEVLIQVFKEFGGKKLSDFDDKPDLYGKMISKMEEALNA